MLTLNRIPGHPNQSVRLFLSGVVSAFVFLGRTMTEGTLIETAQLIPSLDYTLSTRIYHSIPLKSNEI